MEACASGRGVVETVLAKRGADVSAVDINGTTAAHEAAAHGNYRSLFLLNGLGANMNAVDTAGNTPFHLAAAGYADCCRFLRQRGCDPKIKNSKGDTPRVIARKFGTKACRIEIARAEKTYGNVEEEGTEPWALRLYDWADAFSEELLQSLSSIGVQVALQAQATTDAAEASILENQPPPPPQTSSATQKREGLRSGGQSLTSRSSGRKRLRTRTPSAGKTEPAKYIPQQDFIDVLKSLDAPVDKQGLQGILKRLDVDGIRMIDWQSFLTGKDYIKKAYLASAFGERKKKQKGLKAGKKTKIPLDISVMPESSMPRPPDGRPPVMFIPKVEAPTDFLRFDGEHKAENPFHNDSLWYVTAKPMRYLLLHDAVLNEDTHSIIEAIRSGYHVDIRDQYYKTPLMTAASDGNIRMTRLLIQLGANVNARDNFWWTPLHHAAHSGMVDVVELLLSQGAEVDARALNGATPLFRAIETSRAAVVNLLVNRDADITLETKQGTTPLDEAFVWGDPRVIAILMAKSAELKAKETKKSARRPATKKGKKGKGEKKQNTIQFSVVGPDDMPKLFQKSTSSKTKELSQIITRHINLSELETDMMSFPELSLEERLRKREDDRDRFEWDSSLPAIDKRYFNRNISRIMSEMDPQLTNTTN
ncbi:hypothetical protein AAHC03_0463 [Spirometra sp. Aus1]